MALEDPFFVVKDEVLKALLKTRDLFESWKMGDEGRDLRSAEEQEWSTTELRNSLRSIEWDLEDLDDTVQIVEKNPAKFRIDSSELLVRKAFIQQTRDEVNQMKDRVSNGTSAATNTTNRINIESSPLDPVPLAASPSFTNSSSYNQLQPSMPSSSSSQNFRQGNTNPVHHQIGAGIVGGLGNTKYSRLANETDSPTHQQHPPQNNNKTFSQYGNSNNPSATPSSSTAQLIAQQRMQQDQLVAQQDNHLQIMSESVGNLRNVSGQIGNELDEQAVMLDEFGTEIENAESKLDATMRKMAKVLHMSNDRRQYLAIGGLSTAMIVIIIMIFAL